MVIWVYAGGGETERRGLKDFLSKQYKSHTYQWETPARQKPGRRPLGDRIQNQRRRSMSGHGRTGSSLAVQIEAYLRDSLKRNERCDLLLVIDDLDCHDKNERRKLFSETIERVEGAAGIPSFVAFASPEIEAWIIADWNNTVARDSDFRHCHQQMQHWLSTQRSVPFDDPESFSHLDPVRGSCHDKLSEAIIEASIENCELVRYAKADHTARFLRQISPEVVSGKCPLFRQLHARLSQPQ